MKKYRWQGIVFFLIIFILSIGLSYLAFNENSIDHVERARPMAIALVNEDEGAPFNDDKIVFGDQFANSVVKDDRHDWYVVSRGVAESGFERGVYDMMIIIPNDFSARSLSIHLERPEPVSLHYKINATGHESVRAEAEKTAGQILNDFNRRLIDVYFASVIGNLQEAQDNIKEIIDKEKEYTSIYNHQVNDPLSNFTDQFKTVQDYTKVSKESYKGLEDVLSGFESSLSEDAQVNQQFSEEIDSVIKIKEDESQIAATFGEFLEQFVNRLGHEDVMSRLAELEKANEQVYREFQLVGENEPRTKTIMSNANLIKHRFGQMDENISYFQNQLHKDIHTKLEKQIRKQLEDAFKDDSHVNMKINDLFTGLDDIVHTDIREEIKNLPTLDVNEIEKIGLDEQAESDLLTVIKVTDKYNADYKNRAGSSNQELTTIKDKIDKIKEGLESGITVSDKINLTDYDKGEVYLYLSKLPKGFDLEQIELNGRQIRNYDPDTGIKIKPSNQELTLSLELKLKKGFREEIDIFSPLEWEWTVSQEGIEKEEPEENEAPEEVEDKTDQKFTAPPSDKDNKQEEQQQDQDNGTDTGEREEALQPGAKADNEDDSVSNEDDSIETEEKDNDSSNGDNAGEGLDEGSPENEEEDKAGEDEGSSENEEDDKAGEGEETEPPIKEVKEITNNYLYQKVQTSLLADLNEEDLMEAVNEVAEFISGYYKLYSLYELYFGFDMEHQNFEKELESLPKEKPLVTLATENSLYHIFYEKEIKDLIKDHIVKDVMQEITDDVDDSIKDIDKAINSYKNDLEKYSEESDNLVQKIALTKEEANSLNNEIGKILDELAQWRDTSNELTNENRTVLDQDREVQSAVMNLDSGYQPLLLASQSLVDQAKANFGTADHVYQTFDAIDEQAGNIQKSGVNLITHADDLANKLTEKAIEDASYAENFSEVLANSRIGDRQNENLYRFLANPVQTKNDGVITEGEDFTAYFLVIILSIVTLFTAYVISTINQKRMTTDAFTEERKLLHANLPITAVTAGVGLIEGLVIGILSFFLLQFDDGKMYIWLGLILLLTITFLLIATYLLRQLKMVGMFILMTIFSLYLLLTKSLGFRFENKNLVETLQKISPLQYIETLLTNILEGKAISLLVIVILALIAVTGFVLNLFVVNRRLDSKEGMEDENMPEAN
ncbi:type VII secretion protein EsaA [Pseudogracilibacillus sp. SO30301A]|uniref:type VII secretion protein EsaA n=1 Tax=Pseudogracilibacillus sp. SO30301A TaxID=3098291 RepID=UPI00300E284A